MQSDQKRVKEEIAYLEKAISGLSGSARSAESRIETLESEILEKYARIEKIRSDVLKIPALVESMEARLRSLKALDFARSRPYIEKDSPDDLRRKILELQRKLALLE